MINLNYQTDRILYQVFNIILNRFKKKRNGKNDNPSVKYMEIKLRIELHLKLKHNITSSF